MHLQMCPRMRFNMLCGDEAVLNRLFADVSHLSVGTQSRYVCGTDGRWSGRAPLCTPITVYPPGQPNWGTTCGQIPCMLLQCLLSNNRPSDLGSLLLYADRGLFRFLLFPTAVVGVDYSACANTAVGGICYARCASGYVGTASMYSCTRITCRGGAVWQGTPPNCQSM